jgi:2-amino-4-hydroxy-6-hydroxymethyldihydropteridine diphosphokinase
LNNTAVIALGSNKEDRRAHLEYAVSELARILQSLRVSSFIESPPVPPARPEDPVYLNAVVVGLTDLGARDLLARLLEIERLRGRTRPRAGAPRTLDLDLILLGNCVVEEEGLVVPHPRFRERRFVLEPLAEVAPDLVDPVTGLAIRALLADLRP